MFPKVDPTQTIAWKKLQAHFLSEHYLSGKSDLELFQKQLDQLFKVDYTRDLWNETTLELLLSLAEECDLPKAIRALFSGENINETENRAVLHTALRDFTNTPVFVNTQNVKPLIELERDKIQAFVEQVHAGKVLGATGKPINHIVNIGIGGSAIGPRMVIKALEEYRNADIRVDFISSIDATPLIALLETLDLEKTLFLVVSKTFTTLETMTNANLVKEYFIEKLGETNWAKHILGVSAAVTEAVAFGVPEERVFLMWDWVCGRFSLWGSVGLSIALAIGFENYKALLEGAEEMDVHFKSQELPDNIPVLHALLGIWYTNFHNCQSSAIIPYNHSLRELKLYLQQAAMESNGKSVDRNGKSISYATCPVIWGEVGNDAQHSFFQLLHQGTVKIPADFLLVDKASHKHTNNHQLLLVNYNAQLEALSCGRDKQATKAYLLENKMDTSESQVLHHVFAGGKPVTSIVLKGLSPKSLGSLLAMYEHAYFVQGVLWNIYSFDQWGVELGKTLASEKCLEKDF